MIIKDRYGEQIRTLTCEEVIQLHHLLSNHPEILKITEAIYPPGVKDINLLESAVARQMTGIEEYTKYDTVYSNCATLVYGVACNHPFHNGNKRAALLSLIKHLYRNGLILNNIDNDTIYEFLTNIAAGTLKEYAYRNNRTIYKSVYKKQEGVEADIAFIERWIRNYSTIRNNFDKPIKWGELLRKLEKFKIKCHIDKKHGKIHLVKETFKFLGLTIKETKNTYPYKGEKCTRSLIKEIRKDFCLSSFDGVDSANFYDENAFLNQEIITYKKAIYMLSKN
jgi:death-on-curing protein